MRLIDLSRVPTTGLHVPTSSGESFILCPRPRLRVPGRLLSELPARTNRRAWARVAPGRHCCLRRSMGSLASS
jgi:hypothetical protein